MAYLLMLIWHTYQLGYCLYSSGQLVSPWFTYISTLLHLSGMSFIWTLQAFPNVAWLKLSYWRILKDQFLQTWSADLHSSAECTIYRIIKEDLSFERYLTVLPKKWAKFLTKFRCSNHKLPIERLRYTNIPREERHCPFCNKKEIGDEFHYVLQCPHFNTVRQKLLPAYCWKKT